MLDATRRRATLSPGGIWKYKLFVAESMKPKKYTIHGKNIAIEAAFETDSRDTRLAHIWGSKNRRKFTSFATNQLLWELTEH